MAQTDMSAPASNVGKSPSQLKTVDDLVKQMDSLKRARMPLERQWRLNLAFYKGKQYSYYAQNTSNRLESLTVDDGLKPRHRVRIVSNQIMPGSHTLLAQLTKTKPRLYASPGSGDDKERRASQMSQSLLEHWWSDMGLGEKLDEALLWSIIASSGYWKITWDAQAAKQMRFLLGPDGQPIVDEAIKSEFRAQLEKMGVEPQEQIVYMGDIKVDVMSPFDVFPDPIAKVWEECNWVFCKHTMSPDEIKSRWNVTLQPSAVPSSPDSTIPYGNHKNAEELSVREVFIGYFKPTPAMPNGRYVVWVDGPEKKILEDSKWEFPTHQLPIVKFSGMHVPGSVYDDSVVTHAIPLQKELNRTVSQIVEYKNLTVNPVMTAPLGSLKTRRTTEPGQVLEYSPSGPTGNLKPEFEQLPQLPNYVFDHLRDISARLQEVFLSAEVLQGKVPPNVEAGISIDLLQEMATDKLAPIIGRIENSLARSGQQMLSLAQQYYVEQRLMKIRGSGGSVQVKQFQQADIAGNITVHAETGSGLPRTRAGRQARIERLIELQVIPHEKAAKFMDAADLRGLHDQWQADEDLAHRNIGKIIDGIPINPEAVNQMMSAVNQGFNPETGEPLQSPEEAQQLLMKAALSPQLGIDLDTHLDVIALYLKGVEFENHSPQVRQAFFMHYTGLLEERSKSKVQPEPMAPRVNYQIKGTAGPTTSAKILEKAGVEVTTEDTMEPPLETWVSDSVDKPDTDAAGPGQEANNLAPVAQALMEATLADAAAKQQALLSNMEHSDKYGRDTEKHEVEMRKANAEADLAEKKTAQSDFKPKPKAKE